VHPCQACTLCHPFPPPVFHHLALCPAHPHKPGLRITSSPFPALRVAPSPLTGLLTLPYLLQLCHPTLTCPAHPPTPPCSPSPSPSPHVEAHCPDFSPSPLRVCCPVGGEGGWCRAPVRAQRAGWARGARVEGRAAHHCHPHRHTMEGWDMWEGSSVGE
jgi:hypothetical protein